MQQASLEKKFEIALERKKQLESIAILNEKQKVDIIKKFDQDIIAIHSENNLTIINLFAIKRGVIQGKKEFRFETEENLLASFLSRYYESNAIPEEIVISEPCSNEDSEKNALEEYFSIIKGSKVTITIPQRGEKAALVEMVLRNAKFGSSEKILEEMQEKLRLPSVPRVIECFDISNLSYDYIVAGMTQWVDGNPNESEYRKFEIKTVKGKNDDFASIYEVIVRRYSRLKEEGKVMPDLIIIDGGKGQLHRATTALKEVGVIIPIISLAKQQEEIFIPYQPTSLKFNLNTPMMLFIRRMRDSVHNYALSYNRKKRHMRIRNETAR